MMVLYEPDHVHQGGQFCVVMDKNYNASLVRINVSVGDDAMFAQDLFSR